MARLIEEHSTEGDLYRTPAAPADVRLTSSVSVVDWMMVGGGGGALDAIGACNTTLGVFRARLLVPEEVASGPGALEEVSK